ncbi:jg21330 [Pararge aegeria aegeria]|uniref:Jg21330 protein n=1 Tax=Pararge aegeria aegeria TaxID=348720 RepID=A0A8S4QWM4_9NEOP|nr:jg21330 [Pararge aegeria aegeria]
MESQMADSQRSDVLLATDNSNKDNALVTQTSASGSSQEVAGSNADMLVIAKRAPRHPPCLPLDLPASAADLASLSRVVRLLTTTAIKAVTEGKSLTAPNKSLS